MPERSLWAAILYSYFEDARKKINPADVRTLIHHALDDYTKEICFMIDVDHREFMDHLYRVLNKNPYLQPEYLEKKAMMKSKRGRRKGS